ncbi:hypothetical protein [Kingella oralis]|uniref:Uncharacterized protein n=1 Tax=Kingella oralis ATCC 51147 TaxID=629741 RepID=C4GM07_9NEIS|nr:hypothetical protein [Kingella oralis]EEP67158.1 hypothetical protein GCWU000324_02732 [Kingella oralis ATCC 51147]
MTHQRLADIVPISKTLSNTRYLATSYRHSILDFRLLLACSTYSTNEAA